MAGSRSRDTAILIRKAAQFAAGFGTTKGDPTGVATAGTAQQFGKPTLGQQARGGFSAISPAFRSFEESRAGLERSSAVTNLALEEARQLRLAEEQANKPVNLRNLTGGFITERTQKKLEEALDANADGFTTQGELEKGLPKLDKQIIVDAISEDIEEFTKNKKQNEANVATLIEQANKKMLGTGTTITRQDFQTNPELGRTFPKIAEAVTRQDSVQNKIDVLANKRIAIQNVLKREAKGADDFKRLRKIDVIAKSIGVDLDRPITKEEAIAVQAALKKFGDSFMEALFRQRFGGGADTGTPSDRTFGNPLGLSEAEIKNLEQ